MVFVDRSNIYATCFLFFLCLSKQNGKSISTHVSQNGILAWCYAALDTNKVMERKPLAHKPQLTHQGMESTLSMASKQDSYPVMEPFSLSRSLSPSQNDTVVQL